jgi:hypothetical protein
VATRRKVITLDEGVLQALELLSRDTRRPLDELADQAFRELLKKLKRPAALDEALRASLRTEPANDPGPRTKRRRARSHP